MSQSRPYTPEYPFLLQPDPERTVFEPGTIYFRIRLTRDQLRGIAYMADALFTDRRDLDSPVYESGNHFRESLERVQIPGSQFVWASSEDSIIAFVRNVYISSFREALNRGVPWTSVIIDPNLIQFCRFPSINSRYTAVLLNYFNTTFGEIVSFTNLEFLQGAITMCRWFGLNWREWIIEIHEGDTPMEVINI